MSKTILKLLRLAIVIKLSGIILSNVASPVVQRHIKPSPSNLQLQHSTLVQSEDVHAQKAPHYKQGSLPSFFKPEDDYWPEVFPPYEQIDKVLTFVEGLKQGISSQDTSNFSYLILPETDKETKSQPHASLPYAPVYQRPTPGGESTTNPTSTYHHTYLVKKHGEGKPEAEDSWEDEGKYKKKKYPQDSSEEDDDEEEDEEEDEDESTTTAKPKASKALTTTTQAPFKLTDIVVPISFLRIEYMIGYTFFGVWYGLGFLVLWQSILVPIAKFFVFISYLWAVYVGFWEPINKIDALQYIPPNK